MTLTVNLYSDLTGLTLEAQPVDASDATIGSPLTTGFTEVGGGVYLWTVPALPSGTVSIRIQNTAGHAFTGTAVDILTATGTITTVTSATLSDASYQEIARAFYGVSGVCWFVAIGGNSGNDGLTWATAKALPTDVTASAADAIVIGPGTFDQGSSQFAPTAGVKVDGSGPATILTGTYNGAIVLIAGTSEFRDFTITNAGTEFPICPAAGADAVLRNVNIYGYQDCIYFNNVVGARLRVYNSVLTSTWDCAFINVGSGNTLELYDCTVVATALITDPANYSTGISIAASPNSIIRMYGGSMLATGSTNQNAIHADSGTIFLYGGSVQVSGSGTLALKQNAEFGNTGTIVVCNTAYDATKTSGTITVANTPINGAGQIAAGALATDAISDVAVSAAAVTKIQAGLSTYAGGDTPGTTTLLARIGKAIQFITDGIGGWLVQSDSTVTTIGPGAIASPQNFNNTGQTTPQPATDVNGNVIVVGTASNSTTDTNATIDAVVNYAFQFVWTYSGFDLSTYSQFVFTAKSNYTDADTAAIIAVKLTNPGAGGDGLFLLNGAGPVGPVTAADGALTVTVTPATSVAPVVSVVTLTLTARGMGIVMTSPTRFLWETTWYAGGVKQAKFDSGLFDVDMSVRAGAGQS